ncbi:MAG: ATP-binding cassette domain-containing protein [Ruminococcaceae bacterium]|nr:ATP-binding cassette domain-containing protein [Oscillospiraceae bacterium]
MTNMNTPLLELKNIGKIYVSDSNVSVGIRGVDLTFSKGEFVAVTGKSGSGKSTLLNVISGMDTYEEGEMLVEGEPTSHFLQKDWEEYRKQYISFIFQDYNIIESFTVLQNVELALMHIEDPGKRRERAMELLRRVGLEKHVRHKGSKLSGGQKQRTVIARALAKDSPIILADEPTGNLDSQSSKEIIRLLREVAEDKLVVVVTHNFEQVEDYATRHIRIFDGAVELDHTIRPTTSVRDHAPMPEASPMVSNTARKTANTLRNGLVLGRVRFGATPKLSVFLCILMTVTALVLALVTSFTYDSRSLFSERTMFTHVEGRTVIVRRDGQIITDEELEKLAADMGAENYLHYDSMLDRTVGVSFEDAENGRVQWYEVSFGYPASDVKLDAGRYPEKDNEVVLEVPISFKNHLGQDGFEETVFPLLFEMATYKVVGVSYYYDNSRTPRMLFSENGYRIASAIAFFSNQRYNFGYNIELSVPENETVYHTSMQGDTYIDFDLPSKTYYANDGSITAFLADMGIGKEGAPEREDVLIHTVMSGNFFNYQYYYDHSYGGGYGNGIIVDVVKPGYGEESTVQHSFDGYTMVWDVSEGMKQDLETRYYERWQEGSGISNAGFMVLSPDILLEFMYEHYYTQAYTQASLFFENDREAHGKVERLRELGYTAVVSDETIEPDVFEVLEEKLNAGFNAFLFLMAIVFVTAFLSLCSSRAMNATRGDIAIMRSMGIPTTVVRISIYVQTLIALIPATVITAITCAVVYMLPQTNYLFPFLHAGDYILIASMLILVALNLSRKYVKRMFSDSVKKTLKGGSKA